MPKMLFDSARAREMGAKGNLVRWSPKQSPTPESANNSPFADDYQETVKARVRAQLDKVAREIDDELSKRNLDHRRLKELTLCQASLSEQERKAAMRPDPGTLKPARAKPDRARSTLRPAAIRPATNHNPPATKPAEVTPEAQPIPQPIDNCGAEFA